MTKPFDPLHPAPCCYFKHGAYWLVKKGKWSRIGTGLEEAMAEYARRVQGPKDGKLPALIESTLRHHAVAAGISDNTHAQYKRAADVLKRRFAAFDSPAQVRMRHVAQLKADGAATPNMTNRVVTVLRTLFGYWVEQQLCDGNPCVGIRPHREQKRTRLLTPEEWQAVHDAGTPLLQAIMKLQFLTGQRISDVLGIRRSQLTEAGIEFKQQKTGAKLVVRWSPDLRAAVAEALALHRGVQALTLLVGPRRKPPSYGNVHQMWTAACVRAGVEDARPNDQRAQSLTAARRQGKNATSLAGHASEAMTRRYLRDRDTPEVDGPALRQVLDAGQKGA